MAMHPPKRSPAKAREAGIGSLFYRSLAAWALSDPRRTLACAPAAWRLYLQIRRRARSIRELGAGVPYVLAVSPTMRCNYDCAGCYSGGRELNDELSGSELDALFAESERFGVPVVLLTGGEPLLRPELLGLIERRRRLFFVLITNGSLLDGPAARRLARSGNALTLVSIEGAPEHTDSRRGPGAHDAALAALERLRSARAFHGFAATACADNVDYLGSDAFIGEMIRLGCGTGYYSEYVPCDERPRSEWLLDPAARAAFRARIIEQRERKRIVLVQFPHDEYGAANLCSAAGRHSIHIGSRGEVEPCPFVSVSCENVRNGGLEAALRSPFLRSIRERPELLARETLACALFEHLPEIERIANRIRGSESQKS